MAKKTNSISILDDSVPTFSEEISPHRNNNSSPHLKSFLKQAAVAIPADAMEVWLCSPQQAQIIRAAHHGQLKNLWRSRQFPVTESTLGQVVRDGKDLTLNLSAHPFDQVHPAALNAGIYSIICLPISGENGDILGVLCAAVKHPESLQGVNLKLLHLVANALASIISLEQRGHLLERTSVLEERERLGMDLHDGIIQSLYAIGLNLQNLRVNQNDASSSGLARLDQSIQSLDEVIRNIRAYILDLRPRKLQKSNLLQGVHSLLREFRANTDIEVELQDETGGIQGLSQVNADAIFHIFQEALANAARHSRANKLTVRLWRVGVRLMLHVSDDGIGFNPARTNQHIGHGLSNMQLRARSVGGGLEVIAIRRQGTTILAWVPMK
jgi:signal transduction histidine kinase